MNLWDREIGTVFAGAFAAMSSEQRRAFVVELIEWTVMAHPGVVSALSGDTRDLVDTSLAALRVGGSTDRRSIAEIADAFLEAVDHETSAASWPLLDAVANCLPVDEPMPADVFATAISSLYDVVVAVEVRVGSLAAESSSAACQAAVLQQRQMILARSP